MENQTLPLEYRIIEHGIKHGVLVPSKFYVELDMSDVDQRYVEEVLMSNRMDRIEPNQIMVLVNESASANRRDWQYRIAPTALFHFGSRRVSRNVGNARGRGLWR